MQKKRVWASLMNSSGTMSFLGVQKFQDFGHRGMHKKEKIDYPAVSWESFI